MPQNDESFIRDYAVIRSSRRGFTSLSSLSPFLGHNVSNEYIRHTESKTEQHPQYKPKLKHNLIVTVSSMGESGYGNKMHDDFDLRLSSNSHVVSQSRSNVTNSDDQPSSWELWWLKSGKWKRGQVIMLFVLGLIVILQFLFTMYFLSSKGIIKNPYICKSDNCKDLSRWIRQSQDINVSPCENFYEFMCGKHSKKDKGALKNQWYHNIARLESDGESIIAEILKKNDDPIAQIVLKFYQSCADQRRRKKAGFSFYIKFMNEIFGDFNLWDNTAKPQLEDIAVRMIHKTGDYGFFVIEAPINHPELYIKPWVHLNVNPNTGESLFSKDNIEPFLPMIYDTLKIEEEKRESVTSNLLYMSDRLGSLIEFGIPKCSSELKVEVADLDLNYPIWFVYLGEDSMEFDGSKKRWKLKNESDMEITIYPDISGYDKIKTNLESLFKCWSFLTEKIPKTLIRAVYATFWSLRLLLEVAPGIDDYSIRNYNMEKNPLFKHSLAIFNQSLNVRCFQSLLKTMGYTPIFRYFLNRDLDTYIEQVSTIINESATGLLNKWTHPEEGGLPFIRSRYRNRAFYILSGKEDTSLLFPVKEDDPHHPFTKPSVVSKDHMDNAVRWRDYSQNRTFYFWKSKTPKNKLVWYRKFYEVDRVNAFETPGFAAFSLLKFPVSMFIRPFWENDLLLANYAGSYNLAAKAWLNLLVFDFSENNIDENWNDLKKKGKLYREGVASDGDFKACETYTYNWKYSAEGQEFTSEVVEPHSLAFKYGLELPEFGEFINSPFPILLATQSSLDLFNERIAKLLKEPFWTLSSEEQKYLMNRKLIHLEEYSEKQLYFMTAMRDACRSKGDFDAFKHHVTDNLAALMHSNEFSEAWQCPLGSPMNPTNKCF